MATGGKGSRMGAVLVLLIALAVAACGGGGGGSGSSGGGGSDGGGGDGDVVGSDDTLPEVETTSPYTSQDGVATNTAIAVVFSEPMDTANTEDAFTLEAGDGSGEKTGSFAWSNGDRALTFAPDPPTPDSPALDASSVYTVTVDTGATDVAGNPLEAPLSFSFTTGSGMDLVAPYVTGTSPEDDTTDRAVNLPISVSFSESMDGASTEAAFSIDPAVDGSLSWSDGSRLLSFTPATTFAADTPYTVTIAGSAEDLAGNQMDPSGGTFSFSFTTGSGTGSTVEVQDGVTGTDTDGDGQIDEYNLDMETLNEDDLQAILDDESFEGTLVLSADPPVTFEVPLYIDRSGVNIRVEPSGSITLDGENEIETIVSVGADDVTVDGLVITGGLGDVLTQSKDSEGNNIPIKNFTLRNATVIGSDTDDCIQVDPCEDCLFENIVAYNCEKDAVSVKSSTNVKLSNITIGCTTEPGCLFGSRSNRGFIYVFKSSGISIENVEIFESVGQDAQGGSGLMLEQNTGPLTVTGLDVYDNTLTTGSPGYGVYLLEHASADPVTLQDIVIERNAGTALRLDKGTAASTVTVTTTSGAPNNIISDNTEGLLEASGYDAGNCTISNSEGSGNNGEDSVAPCGEGENVSFSP